MSVSTNYQARPDAKSALRAQLSKVADLFTYPDDHFGQLATKVVSEMTYLNPEASEHLQAMRAHFRSLDGDGSREYYVRTFDLNPVCFLYAGYQVYGEEYTRGLLMAGLRPELRRYDLDAEGELPDSVPALLKLYSVMEEREKADSLRDELLLPALEKMDAALEKGENVYHALTKAVIKILRYDAGQTAMVEEN